MLESALSHCGLQRLVSCNAILFLRALRVLCLWHSFKHTWTHTHTQSHTHSCTLAHTHRWFSLIWQGCGQIFVEQIWNSSLDIAKLFASNKLTDWLSNYLSISLSLSVCLSVNFYRAWRETSKWCALNAFGWNDLKPKYGAIFEKCFQVRKKCALSFDVWVRGELR